MSDIFQEVEEDVRRERYEQLWKKYGNYLIAAAAGLVLAVGGYQAWTTYDTNQRQAVSDEYQAAQTIAPSDTAKAEAQFTELSKSGYGGYATLSKFNLAGAYFAQGKRDPAIALLRELPAASDDAVSRVARLRLAWAEADAQPRTEIQTILQPLMAEDNPWRFAAAEILAYVDFRTGSRAQAEADYLRLSQEQQASPSLRQRAAAIIQYLKANPAAGPAAPATPALAGAPASAPATAPTQGTTK